MVLKDRFGVEKAKNDDGWVKDAVTGNAMRAGIEQRARGRHEQTEQSAGPSVTPWADNVS